MHPIKTRFVFTSIASSALGALFLLACSSSAAPAGGGTGASPPSPEAFCTDYCTHVTACDKTQNAQTCTNGCGNELAALLPKMRGDVVTLMQSCVASTDCVELLTTSAVNTCEEEAAASVAVSTEGSSFCSAWSSSAAKCGMSIDATGCLNAMKVYSDDTITGAGACLASACNEMTACIDATFGVQDADAGTATSAEPIHAVSARQIGADTLDDPATGLAWHPLMVRGQGFSNDSARATTARAVPVD